MARDTRRGPSPFKLIILGFVLVILAGTLLLVLPVSSRSGVYTSFPVAIFTSTSAVCVTGLVVVDTATYWSFFGQCVILLLIQIGGVGIVSLAAFVQTLSGKRISLMQKSMLIESVSAHQTGGIEKLLLFMFSLILFFELAGALLLSIALFPLYRKRGIWMALFLSISAFCNAGFDVMGTETGEFSSLTSFQDTPLVVLSISLLIAIGGIGFLTWDDVRKNGLRFRCYRLQSKVILLATSLLILLPSLYLFFFEFSAFTFRERVCLSLFQAITPRTAGFNTYDIGKLSDSARTVIVLLMLIGGSPGSTAGGIKTTTLAVLLATMASVFARNRSTRLFARRIEEGTVRAATAILLMYLLLSISAAMVMSSVEKLSFERCFFETVSAIGTVGLTLGITPQLSTLSKLILVALMFLGRVGGLTLMYAALSRVDRDEALCPVERINVG